MQVETTRADVDAAIDAVYRADWGRIVAALIRLTGDFDVAEEAAQEAFASAVQEWPVSGIPSVPRAWVIQTARPKAHDRIPPPAPVHRNRPGTSRYRRPAHPRRTPV